MDAGRTIQTRELVRCQFHPRQPINVCPAVEVSALVKRSFTLLAFLCCHPWMFLILAQQITSNMAWRILMGAGHSHGPFEEEDEHDHDHGLEHEPEYTLDVRVAAIFVVLVAALIMGLPPIIMKYFQNPDALFARLLRAFAGGTILSLAVIHVIPEAMFQLAGLTEYSFGGVAVLGGILILLVIDSCLQAAWAPKSSVVAHSDTTPSQSEGTSQATGPIKNSDVKVAVADEGNFRPSATHTHHCLRSLSQERWVSASAQSPSNNLKQGLTAYTMELGCIFHSVIIGIGLGVMTDDRAMVVAMMIALAIHQGLEGLSVGSVLGMTNFSRVKKIIMLLMYCVTTPIGIAVGIALSASYDPASITSRAVQGAFNGVSGGMLLYISLLQLIAEEFTRQDVLSQPRTLALMHLALWLGVGAMCVLAIWA